MQDSDDEVSMANKSIHDALNGNPPSEACPATAHFDKMYRDLVPFDETGPGHVSGIPGVMFDSDDEVLGVNLFIEDKRFLAGVLHALKEYKESDPGSHSDQKLKFGHLLCNVGALIYQTGFSDIVRNTDDLESENIPDLASEEYEDDPETDELSSMNVPFVDHD